MTTVEFVYTDWLKSLKPGDKVKTSNCDHRYGCNCGFAVVSGLPIMFKEEVLAVGEGCKVSYYSRENGRQLGTRKGTYKEGNLIPFTEKDQQALDEKKRKEEEKKSLEERSRVLAKLLASEKPNAEWFCSDIETHMTLSEVNWAIDRISGGKK